jgi:iron complex outermembrane receptor protein
MRNILKGALVVALAAPSVARAQGPDSVAPASTASAPSDADIIVTARRRDESLSRVPVSITAFGAEQLANRTITSQADLQAATPGLLVRATANSNDLNYAIRGQSLDAYSGSAAAVLPYFDDAQLPIGGAAALYDLQSVQVLKGPQGTLFGRNTTGGAVLYTTAKPTNELGGFLTGRIGNLDLRQVTGAVNIPIVDDTVLLRVSGDVRSRDGYVLNLFNGKTLGGDERQSGRVILTVKPSESIQNTTVFQYNHASGTNVVGGLYSVNLPGSVSPNGTPLASAVAATYNPAFFDSAFGPGAWTQFLAAHPGIPNMSYADFLNFDRANGKFVNSIDNSGKNRVSDYLLVNTTNISLGDNLSLKNIFGYGRSKQFQDSDPDGTPFPIADQSPFPNGGCPVGPCPGGDFRDTKQVSDELQLAGSTDSLEYLLGLYYSRENRLSRAYAYFFDLLPFAPPALVTNDVRRIDTNYAAFAQASLDLGTLAGLQGVKVTGGFRYTREVINFVQLPSSSFFSAFGPAPERQVVSKPSWTASLEYQANPDLLFYIANRGSWRSGGFNGSAPPIPVTGIQGGNLLLPETTVDIEAGAKFHGRIGGLPVNANLAIYKQWVKDAQRVLYIVVAGALQGATASVPEAAIEGFELEANIVPTRWLEIGGNVAYTHARFTDNHVEIFGQSFDFGPYADTPKWAGSAYAQVRAPIDKIGELIVRGDVYAQSSFYFSNLNATIVPGTKLPGYAVVNGRAELHDIAGTQVSAAVFAKNLLDKGYYVGGLPEGAAFGSNYVIVAEPRTYGLEVSIKF